MSYSRDSKFVGYSTSKDGSKTSFETISNSPINDKLIKQFEDAQKNFEQDSQSQSTPKQENINPPAEEIVTPPFKRFGVNGPSAIALAAGTIFFASLGTAVALGIFVTNFYWIIPTVIGVCAIGGMIYAGYKLWEQYQDRQNALKEERDSRKLISGFDNNDISNGLGYSPKPSSNSSQSSSLNNSGHVSESENEVKVEMKKILPVLKQDDIFENVSNFGYKS